MSHPRSCIRIYGNRVLPQHRDAVIFRIPRNPLDLLFELVDLLLDDIPVIVIVGAICRLRRKCRETLQHSVRFRQTTFAGLNEPEAILNIILPLIQSVNPVTHGFRNG